MTRTSSVTADDLLLLELESALAETEPDTADLLTPRTPADEQLPAFPHSGQVRSGAIGLKYGENNVRKF